MSLRYASRIVLQSGARAAQGTRSVKDSATSSSSSSSSKRVRRFSGALDSPVDVASNGRDKRKRAEEALRMIMFLSVWGPN